MNNISYRQGDVFFKKVDKIPEDSIIQEYENNLVILAYGEKTGHCHGIAEIEKVKDFKNGEKRYIEISDEVILSHGLLEEIKSKAPIGKDHSALFIKPGKYQVIIQREYSPEKIRRVLD